MKSTFYKQRKNKMISGVLAGICDKYGWDLPLVRILVAVFMYFSSVFGIFLYIVLAIFLPYKEDIMRDEFGTGPRKRKDAEPIDEDDNDGWFW